MSNKPVSGIPSSAQASFGHNADFHKKMCEAILPYYGKYTSVVEIEEHLLNNLLGLCNTIKDLVIACNIDDEYQIRPETMAGFIDSIICQVEALKVANDEVQKQIVSLEREVKQ